MAISPFCVKVQRSARCLASLRHCAERERSLKENQRTVGKAKKLAHRNHYTQLILAIGILCMTFPACPFNNNRVFAPQRQHLVFFKYGA